MTTGSMEWSVVSAGGQGVLIEDALTEADKRTVTAATGSIQTPGELNALAARVALDRIMGTLDGPITEAYLWTIADWPGVGHQTILRALPFVERAA